MVPKAYEGPSTEGLYLKMGYRRGPDGLETTDGYLERVTGYMTLYGALLQDDSGGAAMLERG